VSLFFDVGTQHKCQVPIRCNRLILSAQPTLVTPLSLTHTHPFLDLRGRSRDISPVSLASSGLHRATSHWPEILSSFTTRNTVSVDHASSLPPPSRRGDDTRPRRVDPELVDNRDDGETDADDSKTEEAVISPPTTPLLPGDTATKYTRRSRSHSHGRSWKDFVIVFSQVYLVGRLSDADRSYMTTPHPCT
jgi:hypothetical protein